MEARKAALLSLRLAPPSGAPGASQQPHAAAGPSGRPPLPGQASGAAQQQLGGTLQAALTTAAAAPAPEVLVQGCLPYDWALKTSVRFTSTHRFMAYEASAIASCKHSEWPVPGLLQTSHPLRCTGDWVASFPSSPHAEPNRAHHGRADATLRRAALHLMGLRSNGFACCAWMCLCLAQASTGRGAASGNLGPACRCR